MDVILFLISERPVGIAEVNAGVNDDNNNVRSIKRVRGSIVTYTDLRRIVFYIWTDKKTYNKRVGKSHEALGRTPNSNRFVVSHPISGEAMEEKNL